MKQYLLLLNANIRTLLIIIYRYSPTYDALLEKSKLNPNTLDNNLSKLKKKGIIFDNNGQYHIHPNFQKKLTKLLLGNLIKLLLIFLGFFINKSYTRKVDNHLELIDNLRQNKNSR